VSNRVTILDANGWRGYYYYLLFPLDLFGQDSDDRLAYQQAKVDELVPILGWLCPLIVVLTSTTSLGWGSLLLFLSLEAFLLALLTKFHLKLALNQVVEVWLNLWISMTGMAIVTGVVAMIFGGLANPEIDFD
jgi:hypothetical protein